MNAPRFDSSIQVWRTGLFVTLMMLGEVTGASLPGSRSYLPHATHAREGAQFLERLGLLGEHRLQAYPVFHYNEGGGDQPKNTSFLDEKTPARELFFSMSATAPFELNQPLAIDAFGQISAADNYGMNGTLADARPEGYYVVTIDDAYHDGVRLTERYHVVDFDPEKRVLHLEVPGGFYAEERSQISVWTRVVKGVERVFVTTFQNPHGGYTFNVPVENLAQPKGEAPAHEPHVDEAEVFGQVVATTDSRQLVRKDAVYLALLDVNTGREISLIPSPVGVPALVSIVGENVSIEVPSLGRRLLYSASDGRYLTTQNHSSELSDLPGGGGCTSVLARD